MGGDRGIDPAGGRLLPIYHARLPPPYLRPNLPLRLRSRPKPNSPPSSIIPSILNRCASAAINSPLAILTSLMRVPCALIGPYTLKVEDFYDATGGSVETRQTLRAAMPRWSRLPMPLERPNASSRFAGSPMIPPPPPLRLNLPNSFRPVLILTFSRNGLPAKTSATPRPQVHAVPSLGEPRRHPRRRPLRSDRREESRADSAQRFSYRSGPAMVGHVQAILLRL